MSAKSYKLTPAPAPAGHTDGEAATLPARDHGLTERDSAKIADVSPPLAPSYPDHGRGPGAKPFRNMK
jgi:hypothetical protein